MDKEYYEKLFADICEVMKSNKAPEMITTVSLGDKEIKGRSRRNGSAGINKFMRDSFKGK